MSDQITNMQQLFELPYELQRMVISKLEIIDRYCLQLALGQYEDEVFLPNQKHINCSMDHRFDHKAARYIFKKHPRLLQITSVNLNGVYWMQAQDLRKYLSRMPNVERLYLMDTKISLEKSDIILYNTLEKLKEIFVYHKRFESIRAQVEWKKLQYRLHRIVPIDSPYWFEDYERGYCSYGIRSEGPLSGNYIATKDWLNKLCGVDHLNSDRVATLKFNEILGSEQFPVYNEELLRSFSKHHTLTVVNRMSRDQFPNGAFKSTQVSYKPIFTFEILTHLTLEVDMWTDICFMEPLVTQCTQLKFLKIINYTPRFALSHLHLAHNLEDISYHSNCNFQLAKFLDDVLHKKFRRIFLKFPKCSNLNYNAFETFMSHNKDMVLFALMTTMPMTFTRHVQRMLDATPAEPHQVFRAFQFKNLGDNIPLAHMDMAHVCYNSNGKIR